MRLLQIVVTIMALDKTPKNLSKNNSCILNKRKILWKRYKFKEWIYVEDV